MGQYRHPHQRVGGLVVPEHPGAAVSDRRQAVGPEVDDEDREPGVR